MRLAVVVGRVLEGALPWTLHNRWDAECRAAVLSGPTLTASVAATAATKASSEACSSLCSARGSSVAAT